MTDRRSFLKKTGILGSGLFAMPFGLTLRAEEIEQKISSLGGIAPEELATDEDFWSWVRLQYSVSGNLINLNNGGVSPHPVRVKEAVTRFSEMSNEAPSYYMWRIFDDGVDRVKDKLALLGGVGADEIAIHRNTTEALDTIIFGIDLEKGDEVVHSNFIYPNMNQAWGQRAMREGIVRNIAKLPMPTTDHQALIKAYTDQFTKNTKVVHITHLINWTGQVIPTKTVAAIATKAKEIGAKVIVDGAHSFAHLDYKIPELNCDFFATSLHKWLCAPFGTGMLYVKKESIADLWPLFPNPDPRSSDIKKFEALGTRDIPSELAIGEAIDFHLAIGAERKFERLHYLKQYWIEQVKDIPGIQFWCPQEAEFSGALTTFSLEGITGPMVSKKIFQHARIHTTSITHEGISGCRITPNVYTSKEELDVLIKTIHHIASNRD